MGNTQKIAALILVLLFSVSAVKVKYGGEISIRLNEPPSYSFTPSDYSNLIFYSLIYENFFYLKNSGDIVSYIFSGYRYEPGNKTLVLDIDRNLSYADGNTVSPKDVKDSLRVFLDMNLASSRKLRGVIKSISTNREENRVFVELLYDKPDIVSLMTAPELALLSSTGRTYSGMFYPVEKVQDKYILLKANKFYPGGQSYLDSFRVAFSDSPQPDIFLSSPGKQVTGYREFNSGVYQNIYLLFPREKVGKNTRIALYSLLKSYYKSQDEGELSAFTSNDESPITLNIKTFSDYRIRQILRYSDIKLHISRSLSDMEDGFQDFLKRKRVPIKTVYLGDNQVPALMDNASVDFLLLGKIFTKRMPLEEKIKKILKEMSYSRFSEKYLKLINELDEVAFLKNEEMLINQVTRIIEQMTADGFILPLFQNNYSLYVKDSIQGLEIDYYGRPLFFRVR